MVSRPCRNDAIKQVSYLEGLSPEVSDGPSGVQDVNAAIRTIASNEYFIRQGLVRVICFLSSANIIANS